MGYVDEREPAVAERLARRKHRQRWSSNMVVPEAHLHDLRAWVEAESFPERRLTHEITVKRYAGPLGFARVHWQYGGPEGVRGANRDDVVKILAQFNVRVVKSIAELGGDSSTAFIPGNNRVERLCGCPRGQGICREESEE